MKTKDILNLDFRDKDNQNKMQKVLKQIKPLSKYSDDLIPIDAIEKCLVKLCSKYDIYLFLGFSAVEQKNMLWSIKAFQKGKEIGKVYGISTYELLCKAVVLIYSKTRKGVR